MEITESLKAWWDSGALVLLGSTGEGQQQGRRPFNRVDSEV